jgi:hypothetical protein
MVAKDFGEKKRWDEQWEKEKGEVPEVFLFPRDLLCFVTSSSQFGYKIFTFSKLFPRFLF